MNCKKILLLSALVASLAVPVYAGHDHDMSVDEKVQKLKSELNLTDEQTTKIKPIIEEYKEKVSKISEEKHDKLKEVLTVEQLDKLNDMKKDKD